MVSMQADDLLNRHLKLPNVHQASSSKLPKLEKPQWLQLGRSHGIVQRYLSVTWMVSRVKQKTYRNRSRQALLLTRSNQNVKGLPPAVHIIQKLT
jgi:hypothetical protein